jgi:hypothetical protein
MAFGFTYHLRYQPHLQSVFLDELAVSTASPIKTVKIESA